MLRPDDLRSIISEVNPDHSLPQDFYTDESLYSIDMEHVVGNSWLLIDHADRVKEVGSFFLFSIDGESIIIVRESPQKVSAFFNVCRHRGSRVCLENEGIQKLFTCPYHAWSYRTDGSLVRPRSMPEDFNPEKNGLHRCHLTIWHGLIFICLCRTSPPPFETEFSAFEPWADYHEFGNAKIAHRSKYQVTANWKLAAENFLECYHCGPAHPEFCTRQDMDATLAFGSGLNSGPAEAAVEYAPRLEEWENHAALLGRPKGSVEDDENSLNMKFLMQRPHRPDILSETADGQPVACVMGKRKNFDGGHMHLCFNPFSHVVSCSDYAVLFRFTPISRDNTEIELIWLVDGKADVVDTDRLSWMWDVTTKQDQIITESNYLGVCSTRYRPGRYSDEERKVVTFVNWYLKRLIANVPYLKNNSIMRIEKS